MLAPLLALPMLEVVAAFLIVGLIVAGRPLAEAISRWLDSVLGSIPIIGHRIAGSAVSLTRWLSNTLVTNSAGTLDLGARWLAGVAQWAEIVIGNALAWPYWMLRFQEWLLLRELPRLIHGLPTAVTKVVHATTARVVRVERVIVRTPKLAHALSRAAVAHLFATLVHPYFGMLRWLRAHVHALEAVIPRTVPLPTVPSIPNLRKRVARLEKLLAAGVGVAVVLRALARLRLGWLRCNKVGRLGRAACGLDEGLLESMLTDALAIFSVISVVEFARELRAVEDEAIGIMGRLVREWPG